MHADLWVLVLWVFNYTHVVIHVLVWIGRHRARAGSIVFVRARFRFSLKMCDTHSTNTYECCVCVYMVHYPNKLSYMKSTTSAVSVSSMWPTTGDRRRTPRSSPPPHFTKYIFIWCTVAGLCTSWKDFNCEPRIVFIDFKTHILKICSWIVWTK